MTSPESAAAAAAAARYSAIQAAITQRLAATILRAMRQFGVPLTDDAREVFARAVLRDVERARRLSYVNSVQLMQRSAELARRELPPVAPIPRYEPAAIVKVLERAVAPIERAGRDAPPLVESVRERDSTRDDVRSTKVSPAELDQVTRNRYRLVINYADPRDPATVTRIGEDAGAALARHAHQAGRDAVQRTAEPAEPDAPAGRRIGWARVMTGDETCAFCAMLASRGPVYSSEHAATIRGGIYGNDSYHDHCDCVAILVFEGQDWHGREEYERLEALWIESTRGKYGPDARNEFRRAWNAERAALELSGDGSGLQRVLPEGDPVLYDRDRLGGGSKVTRAYDEIDGSGFDAPRDDPYRYFDDNEQAIADWLTENDIHVRSVSEEYPSSSPDALIDAVGRTVELKTIKPNSANPRRALYDRLRASRDQSRLVVADVRNGKATREQAKLAIADVLRNGGRDLDEVVVVGDDFVLSWP